MVASTIVNVRVGAGAVETNPPAMTTVNTKHKGDKGHKGKNLRSLTFLPFVSFVSFVSIVLRYLELPPRRSPICFLISATVFLIPISATSFPISFVDGRGSPVRPLFTRGGALGSWARPRPPPPPAPPPCPRCAPPPAVAVLALVPAACRASRASR